MRAIKGLHLVVMGVARPMYPSWISFNLFWVGSLSLIYPVWSLLIDCCSFQPSSLISRTRELLTSHTPSVLCNYCLLSFLFPTSGDRTPRECAPRVAGGEILETGWV